MSFAEEFWNGDKPLRIQEVAEVLRVSDKTVRRLITSGRLMSVKVRGIRLIRASAVRRLIPQEVG